MLRDTNKPPIQYDVPALKALALNQIRSELGKCDIVEESFSRFSSRQARLNASTGCLLMEKYRYSEIRYLYVNQLAYTWAGDSTAATRLNVEKKIDSFVEGDLEHATEAFTTLWKIANKDGNVAAPPNALPAVSPPRFLP
jgi:hypothetical protein